MTTTKGKLLGCACGMSPAPAGDCSILYCSVHGAAPELLAACEAAANHLHQYVRRESRQPGEAVSGDSYVLNLLQQAITSAKGE